MTLTAAEIDSLRFHLGYGNLATPATPYTGDGFYSLIANVVSPNLSTGTETSSTTAVTANSTTTITVVSATDIAVYGELIIDVADQAEVVRVKAVSGTSVTAYFTKAHTDDGYPVATMSGLCRLRFLLHQADIAWQAWTSETVGSTSGIKKVDEIEFFGGGGSGGSTALNNRLSHYKSIVESIAHLVRVASNWQVGKSPCRIEAY